jgi:hypothetical protein
MTKGCTGLCILIRPPSACAAAVAICMGCLLSEHMFAVNTICATATLICCGSITTQYCCSVLPLQQGVHMYNECRWHDALSTFD